MAMVLGFPKGARAGGVGVGTPVSEAGHAASPTLSSFLYFFLGHFQEAPGRALWAFPWPVPSLLRNALDFPGLRVAAGIK